MNKLLLFIKEFSATSGEKEKGKYAPKPSLENIAHFKNGAMNEAEEENLLRYLLYKADDEELRKYVCLLDKEEDLSAEAPGCLVENVKKALLETSERDILKLIIEFGDRVMQVLETTGTVIDKIKQPAVAPALRGTVPYIEKNSVKVSKTLTNYIVDFEVIKTDNTFVHLNVDIKDRKNKKPLSNERVSLIYQGAEYVSAITTKGKVSFDNIELLNYSVCLVRGDESYIIGEIILNPCQE